MDTSLSEAELETLEVERANRSIFMQDVLLSTLMISADDSQVDTKQALPERAIATHQIPSLLSSEASVPTLQPSSAVSERPKNGSHSTGGGSTAGSGGTTDPGGYGLSLNDQQHQPTIAKRNSQLRMSPSAERTTSSQRTVMSQSRAGGIDYMLSSRPHQPPTDGNSISVREVLVGNNYSSPADTARRKPICTVDNINQTTEPPTSH